MQTIIKFQTSYSMVIHFVSLYSCRGKKFITCFLDITITMATNLSLLLSIVFLLLVTQPIGGHSFKSFQHLEGSHKDQTVKGLHEIKHYLSAFGYLKLNHSIGMSKYDHASVKEKDEFDDYLERAIKSFQKNFHLNVTRRLDSSTLDKMMTPRPDVEKLMMTT